jgi:hypothetical protein
MDPTCFNCGNSSGEGVLCERCFCKECGFTRGFCMCYASKAEPTFTSDYDPNFSNYYHNDFNSYEQVPYFNNESFQNAPISQQNSCEYCGGPHFNTDCQTRKPFPNDNNYHDQPPQYNTILTVQNEILKMMTAQNDFNEQCLTAIKLFKDEIRRRELVKNELYKEENFTINPTPSCEPLNVEDRSMTSLDNDFFKRKVFKIKMEQLYVSSKFKNQTLRSYFEKVGIEHQTSNPRTPEQNGVVERRNRTLVEAARTMLINVQLPDYLWAEAVSTACYTQNRCMITKRHHKTPYQIVHKRTPNISYFHVFGALCYPVNDRDDLGKLKAKADIGIFVGYCENSKGFRIWNRRTREIQETIHANFDELTQMASEQNSLGPASNRLNFPNSSAEPLSLSHQDVETLFAPLFGLRFLFVKIR